MRLTDSTAWPPSHAAGGHPKASESYDQALVTVVEQAPRDLAQPFSSWTCGLLAAYLHTQGQIALSDETVRRHLHAKGYGVVRPSLTIRSPDPAYVAKAAQLQTYQAQARRGEIVLLFEDEIDLHLLPGIAGCWTKRGTQRKVATPGQNQKRYGFGAVNMVSGALTRTIRERKNSDSFCTLLEQIIEHYCPGERWQGRKVVLVLDNFIIHRSKRTQKVLDHYADRLIVCGLPTYAPKLNLIELLWKHLRRRVTHNHLFESVAALGDAVERFFAQLDSQPATVLSIIGCSE